MMENLAALTRYCPRCGSTNILRNGGHIVCQACGHQHYVNPAVAVGALVLNQEERMLFLRRAKDPGKGLLGMPGGFVDAGETAEEALRREVREETGLELKSMAFLLSHPNRYNYAGICYDVLDLFFICRVDSFHAAQALDEVEAVVIRPPSAVSPDEIAFPSMRAALAHWNQLSPEMRAAAMLRA